MDTDGEVTGGSCEATGTGSDTRRGPGQAALSPLTLGSLSRDRKSPTNEMDIFKYANQLVLMGVVTVFF